jgi:hypothetical protein
MLDILLLITLALGVFLRVYGNRRKVVALKIISVVLIVIALAFLIPDFVRGFIYGFRDGLK